MFSAIPGHRGYPSSLNVNFPLLTGFVLMNGFEMEKYKAYLKRA